MDGACAGCMPRWVVQVIPGHRCLTASHCCRHQQCAQSIEVLSSHCYVLPACLPACLLGLLCTATALLHVINSASQPCSWPCRHNTPCRPAEPVCLPYSCLCVLPDAQHNARNICSCCLAQRKQSLLLSVWSHLLNAVAASHHQCRQTSSSQSRRNCMAPCGGGSGRGQAG